jgi:two-component system sensor histidine kinase YesM
MILAYIFVIIVPLILVGFGIVREFRQTALTDAIEQTAANVERVKLRTAEILNISIELSNRLAVNEQLEDIANGKYESTLDVYQTYREFTTVRTYLDFNKEISNIKLYINNKTLLNNWELLPLDANTEQSFWYQSALNGLGFIGWYYFDDITRNAASSLSLVRRIHFPEYQTFAIQVIDLNTNYLNSILSQEQFETVLLDENNIVVASNRPNMIRKNLSETHLGESIVSMGNGSHEIDINGEASKVYIEDFMPPVSYSKLRIISIFSIESIVAEANRISRMGFTVIMISFAIALVLIYLICTIIAKRLLNLSKQIGKVSKGHFNSTLEVDGNDEIGQISRQFNGMVFNIKDLMDEVKQSNEQKNQLELKQNEIKLKMLASQINPHFLYNALESIRMKAHLKGEREIAQTVMLLGKLLRKNLEITGKKISVNDEFEIIRNYLAIQKFRYEDRLDYELDLVPAAMMVMIPPLIIQPLVENAVLHGLENQLEGGLVTVKAYLDHGHLNIEVTDNGIGMNASQLEMITQSIHDQDEERIGMSNVHQRIQLTYGMEYGLHVQSVPTIGTKIQFSIPLEESHV